MSLTAGARIGGYDVVSRLGEGGMGVVYRARDIKLGRDVAIKALPESFASDRERASRFEREAKLLASLNHPNIAAIYGLKNIKASSFSFSNWLKERRWQTASHAARFQSTSP